MSKLIVEVVKVSKIYKHPNADKLSIIEMENNSWTCIVGLNQFKIGDLVIYCPIDSIIPENIIDQYNLEYLKKDGRVKTVKLRGYISSGLILEIPKDKNWKKGKDVSKELGIIKYEPKPPSYQVFKAKDTIINNWIKFINKKITFRRFLSKSFGIIQDYFKPKKNPNPFFTKYTDISNYRHYNNIFKEGDLVVISEKLHGCLVSKSKILLADGNTKTIQEIVETKYEGSVLGVDNNGKLVPSKIKNWFINGSTKEWLKISYQRPKQRGNSHFTIVCTPNHEIYNVTHNKYSKAKELIIGNEVLCGHFVSDIPYHIKQILIGKMLGDGSLGRQSIVFGHKKEHKEYIDYTLKSLGYLAGNYQQPILSGYGTEMLRARTKSCESIKDLFSDWFVGGQKQIPPLILSPISLAFWYMDDGSLSHTEYQEDRLAIATNGFSEQSVDNLIEALKKIDIKGIKYQSSGWRIRINKEDASKFFMLITPYIPKCMQYKLPKIYRGNSPISFPDIQLSDITKQTCKKIVNISWFPIKNMNQKKYDIETDTHNFFVNNCLVHNSNFRAGNIPKKNKDWGDEKQEFIYGSHNIQLFGNRGKNCYYGEDIYGKIAERYNLAEMVPSDYIIYGEVFGLGVQDMAYDLKEIDVRFFDIKYKGKYLDYMDFGLFCNRRKLPMVPILYMGKFSKEILNKLVSGKSTIAKHIREGIVIKSLKEETHPKIGRKILKYVSDDYLVRKNGTEHK